MTGGINNVYRNSSGFHLAGLSNSTGGNMIGVQIAGLYNYSNRLVMGGQIGGVNVGGGILSGFQVGLINRIKELDGREINATRSTFGVQFGVINYSKINNGIQIGLINRAKKITGIQVGLINFYKPSPYSGANRYNGIPIGLINIGTIDSRLRISRSRVIPQMIEFSTGNCHNCSFTESRMPFDDRFYKTNQNVLIFGYDYWDESDISWAVGYGFHRVYYNKASASPHDSNNRRYYFSPAIRFVHLNRTKKYDATLSLLTQLRFEAGIRLKRITYFVGGNINAYFNKFDSPLSISGELANKQGNLSYQVWPDIVYGLKIQYNYPPKDNLKELVRFFLR